MAEPLGVSLAFNDGPHVVNPTWTRLDTLDGCRVQEWSISRGRPSEFEPVGAGTATVRIVDREGLFDPTNGASPYFPNVLPDRQAAIALYDPVLEEWQTRFRGFVDDLSYQLDQTRQFMVLELELIDGFGYLVDSELMPGVAGVVPPPTGSDGNVVYAAMHTPQDRLEAVADDVHWPAGLCDFFTGNVWLTQAVYAPGTDALAAMQDAADGEFAGVAVLFCSRRGILTFHGRQARFRPDVAEYGIRRQIVGDPSLADSDPTVCPLHELSFSLGKEHLYNSVLAYPMHTAITGSTPTATATVITEQQIRDQLLEDATSILAHGKKSLSFTDLLTLEGIATGNTALEETLLVAGYYRDNYHQPLPRPSRMVFKSRRPDHPNAGPLWKMMCRSDISDLLTLTTAHPGGGGFDETDFYVEGFRQTCRPGGDVDIVELELDVSPRALFDTNPFDADPDPA